MTEVERECRDAWCKAWMLWELAEFIAQRIEQDIIDHGIDFGLGPFL